MEFLRCILRKLLHRGFTTDELIKQLKQNGAHIGNRLNIYGKVNIDPFFPYMLNIGDDVEITTNVTILNHDYSWSVIKAFSGELLGGIGYVNIGNNVFIGTGSTILMNTSIGNNCIIGANSVVSGTFPDNSVIAGNPARIICSLEKFIEKRRKRQQLEAIEIVRHYRKAFGINPSKDKFPAYFWLFEPRYHTIDTPVFVQRMHLKNNYELSNKLYSESKPLYDSFEHFLNSIPFEN